MPVIKHTVHTVNVTQRKTPAWYFMPHLAAGSGWVPPAIWCTDCSSLASSLCSEEWSLCVGLYFPTVRRPRYLLWLNKVHRCPIVNPSHNPCCEQQELLFLALLKVEKQCGSPWLLNRIEETICSQKCRFPWGVNIWQMRSESFVDKTADFESIEAFKKDHSA